VHVVSSGDLGRGAEHEAISEVGQRLKELRHEVDELQGKVDTMARRRGSVADGKSEPQFDYDRAVRESAAKSGDKVALGFFRGVVMLGPEGGTNTSSEHGIWTGPIKEPPTEEQVLKSPATVIGANAFAMRALFYLMQPFYEGQPMQKTAAALAGILGISEAELHQQLAPVVAIGTVRHVKSAEGEETYKLEKVQDYVALLAMAL
jgi:hypothetical protein